MNPTKNKHYVEVNICDEWTSVNAFITWAETNGWKKGLSIERVDVSGDYSPDNCKWIPLKHQARNRRDNSVTPEIAKAIHKEVADGKIRYHVAKEYAAKYLIPLSTAVKVAYGYNWKD